jgi:hypothetical protein
MSNRTSKSPRSNQNGPNSRGQEGGASAFETQRPANFRTIEQTGQGNPDAAKDKAYTKVALGFVFRNRFRRIVFNERFECGN